MLNSLCERNGISKQELEDARRTQQFFGGELVSHCLSLGFVDERSLMDTLVDRYQVPATDHTALRNIPSEAIAAIPGELLEKHRCCPLYLEAGTLGLAMINPRDQLAIREIERKSGLTIKPHVTIEYRLHLALKRYYRIDSPYDRQGLSIAPAITMRNGTPSGTGSDTEDPDDNEEQIGLDGLPLDASPELEEFSRENWRASEMEVDTGDDDDSLRTGILERSLLDARDRNDIATALLLYCNGFGSRRALFACRGKELRPILGQGDGWHGDRVTLSLDPARPTVWTTAFDSHGFYCGPVAPTANNRAAFEKLWGTQPDSALILPIHVRGRHAALLYIDNQSQALDNSPIPALRKAALKTGLAFERLLLQKKLLDC